MKNFLKKYSYAFFMGLGLGFFGIYFLNWQFYAFVIPMILLVELHKTAK